jgi:phenylpropionate dioxygenase-like ring-hydroxylating dioxygenase large terminal subunit
MSAVSPLSSDTPSCGSGWAIRPGADPDLVPDFHWMDSPEWAVAHGYHFIHADYRLLVDNLFDLSHETFVHPETIGNSAVADSPVSVKIVNERTVCAHRDMLGAAPPQFVALAGFSGRSTAGSRPITPCRAFA